VNQEEKSVGDLAVGAKMSKDIDFANNDAAGVPVKWIGVGPERVTTIRR